MVNNLTANKDEKVELEKHTAQNQAPTTPLDTNSNNKIESSDKRDRKSTRLNSSHAR